MNAVIYARYSTGPQQTEQSIEGQLRVCREYAAREGWQIVDEYIDRALTGRSDDRPAFLRMMSDAKHKQFQRVLVYKLDRFARNLYDFVVYERTLNKCGVTIISVMEGISDNPEGILLKALLAASAEYYSAELSQKIKRGRVDGARAGKFVGGSVPFGYKTIGGRLIIDEVTAPHIKWAFEQYAAGVPRKQIADALNAHGLRTSRGEAFGHSSFQTAFRCEKYIGVLEQSGVRTEGGCPAIVDVETFERVQQRMDMNKHAPAMAKAKVPYLLTGKLFCGPCGDKMVGVSGTGKHGDVHVYYSCTGRRKNNGCKKRHEKKDFLEWYVTAQTVEYVLTPDHMELIAESIIAEYENQFGAKQIKELEERIAKLDRDMRKMVDAVLDMPQSARKQLYDKMEETGNMKADLEIDLAKLRIANGIHYKKDEIKAWIKQFCNGDAMDMEFRRRIIDVFINSVYLYDDKVIIFYNIRGGKQVSYIGMLEAIEEPVEEAAESPLAEGNVGSYIKGNAPPRLVVPPPRSGGGRYYTISIL
jgi:DNA invertase Pin-like site-specific DNA recombinase